MIDSWKFVTLLVAAAALTACEDRAPRAGSPAVRAEREAAYRQACAADLLARRAAEEVQVLETTLAGLDPAEPLSDINRRVATAALDFSRAFERHAELRLGAYANLDSAVNHASTTADSARYVTRAGSFSIRAPEEGTVEANVFERYQSDLVALLEDENHPCNWDFPF